MVLAKERPELGLEPTQWSGSVGILFGYEDEVAPAKILFQFRKKNEVIAALGGVFEHHWVGAEEVKTLSSLPGKQELRGQLVGMLQAPVRGVVGTMNGVLRNLVGVLAAIGKAKA